MVAFEEDLEMCYMRVEHIRYEPQSVKDRRQYDFFTGRQLS